MDSYSSYVKVFFFLTFKHFDVELLCSEYKFFIAIVAVGKKKKV